MNFTRWIAPLAATAALLAACGGSDEPGPPSIDTAPASLTVPEGDSATFTVLASGEGPLGYRWLRGSGTTSVGSAATLQVGPATLYDDAATYKVEVSNNRGATMSPTATLSVTPRRWSDTPLASGVNSEPSANATAGAVDAQGNFVFAFFGPSTSADRAGVWLGRQTPTGTFFATRISGSTDGGTTSPAELRLALDSSGAAMVVWRRNGNGSEVYASVARWGDGADVPVTRISNPGDFAMEPAVAAVGNGTFEVLWAEVVSGTTTKLTTRRFDLNGNTWAAPQVIATTLENVSWPRIASDGAGRVWTAWAQYPNQVYTLYGKERTASMSAWDNSAPLVLGTAGARDPVLELTSTGQGVLTANDVQGRVYVRRLTSSGWSSAQYVANAFSVKPGVAIHNDGRIAIASMSTGTQFTTLYHWTYDPLADTWSAPLTLRSTSASTIGSPAVKFDAAGNQVVLWSEREPNNGPGAIRARRFIAGGIGWLADVAVSPLIESENDLLPALAVGNDGKAMALWYHESATQQWRLPQLSLLR